MPIFRNLKGQRFGRVLVLGLAPTPKHRPKRWRCQCDCGEIKVIIGTSLTTEKTKSCGCLRREVTTANNTTHGVTGSPEYKSWNAMWQRCTNPKRGAWKYYGARGIRVSPAWKSFERFYKDLGPRPPGKTLERKDSNGNYNKTNCCWATPKEQAASRRKRAKR